jgi:formylglycine-generating enzyme required for sulfatase activity
MAVTFLFMTLAGGYYLESAGAAQSAPGQKAYIGTAANGEKIPYPTSTATYTVKDGSKSIQVPEGMVYVPAGSFVMGTNRPAGMPGTGNPAHTVKLSAYCIAKYMVTNAEYKAFCDEMGSNYRSSMWPSDEAELDAFLAEKPNHPVLGVSWTNAMAYCDWISSKIGRKITLPSEAQWERAARGATTDASQYDYPWGNTDSYDDYRTHLNYIMNVAVKYGQPKKEVTYGNTTYDVYWPFVVTQDTGNVINQRDFGHREDNAITTDIVEDGPEARAVWDKVQAERGCTTAVGSFSPSPAGCYDMAGNAFQWTRDWFTVSYYISLAEQMTDPVVEDEAVLTKEDIEGAVPWAYANGSGTKVIRGGSWYAQKGSAKTVYRSSTNPGRGGNVQGFRVVMLNP